MKNQCMRDIKKFSFHIGQWTSGMDSVKRFFRCRKCAQV
ncbi:hypothetical protein E2C01_019456 [Portunus trituberculatus]|uniref:Uncharacterized protein n=1 Tax=Portunus trituberculatus TaxID=210409 RepID=A0A5B7DX94_PORTR|nr:hypothetical protein [Portunus trituberculatus]